MRRREPDSSGWIARSGALAAAAGLLWAILSVLRPIGFESASVTGPGLIGAYLVALIGMVAGTLGLWRWMKPTNRRLEAAGFVGTLGGTVVMVVAFGLVAMSAGAGWIGGFPGVLAGYGIVVGGQFVLAAALAQYRPRPDPTILAFGSVGPVSLALLAIQWNGWAAPLGLAWLVGGLVLRRQWDEPGRSGGAP